MSDPDQLERILGNREDSSQIPSSLTVSLGEKL